MTLQMNTCVFILVPWFVLTAGQPYAQDEAKSRTRFPEFTNKHFSFTEVTGIGREEGITRRDPSDVIKVGDTHYVWYSKVTHAALPERERAMVHSGYVATVWYATSTDAGHTWKERGEALGLGKPGTFDAQAVFTPNILAANGKYYLFYTGVKPTPGREAGGFANNNTTDFTAIGLAVADSPDGPFLRLSDDPVLTTSTPSSDPTVTPSKFDSYRVDDASLLIRDGKYWLYYKGRNFDDGQQGPRFTKMGVAIADKPEGPYVKQNDDAPILDKSHEVLIWPHRQGVAAYASFSQTIEYAADGLDFTSAPLHAPVQPKPVAPGAYRPDLTEPVKYGRGAQWGISMRAPGGPFPYLVRWEADLSLPDIDTAGKPVDVYLFGGQSNMQGLGKVAELPDEERQPIAGAWFWNDAGFEPIAPGATMLAARAGDFGPELAFARNVRAERPECDLAIAKYWSSGQSLDHGWNGNRWIGGETPDDPNLGVRYAEMLKTFRNALAYLDAHDVPYTIRGIVWMQGEQDGKHAESAERYAGNLKRLNARLHEDLDIEPVPFVFGQVLPKDPPEQRFTHRDEVRRSQAHADRSSGHADSCPNVWMVSTDGLPIVEDGAHYSSEGQIGLGKRLADTMLQAISIKGSGTDTE